MSFASALGHVDSVRLAIATVTRDVTFSDLLHEAATLAPAMSGQRVILNHPDLLLAVRHLIAADGCANSIALMSPEHKPAVLAPLMDSLSPDYVISDQGNALVSEELSAPVCADTFSLPASGKKPRVDTDWIMSTSGTTGTPKLVSHSFASLTRTSRFDNDRGQGQVWGMLYDYSRFAGLQVVLQSLMSGACLVVPPQEAAFDEQLSFLGSRGCTHLSATPTMWRKILMCPQHRTLDLHQITMGGEIVDNSVLASVARAWPNARISHIFASTEAGVGFSVVDRQEGFPASYLTDPPSGIGLRVTQNRLWVRNELVGAEYLGGRGALAQDGWVDTGDMVKQHDNRVHFLGRENGVINVGGNKVHPEEVERALLSHPYISMARVYAKANPIMGALVMADVVPKANAPETLISDLNMFLRARLEKHMVPVSVRSVDTLEINSAGKIGRGS